jgi:hypothetical protein
MQNYLTWQVVMERVSSLSRRFKDARAHYRKVRQRYEHLGAPLGLHSIHIVEIQHYIVIEIERQCSRDSEECIHGKRCRHMSAELEITLKCMLRNL